MTNGAEAIACRDRPLAAGRTELAFAEHEVCVSRQQPVVVAPAQERFTLLARQTASTSLAQKTAAALAYRSQANAVACGRLPH